MTDGGDKIFVNISALNFQELKTKYPGVDIEGIIDKKVKYYRAKPFKERNKLVWIEKIKEFLSLVNEDYKEGEILQSPKEEAPVLEESKLNFEEVYNLIMDVLRYYCDIEEKYYSLIALWIIGTYFHQEFPTYPYLFFNAMRGSGKSRVLILITYLSKDGSMLNSLTEAVLFRTGGTLGIDEFEGITRKGSEQIKELLNSAYKKGIKVKRMRKDKLTEQQEVEEFEVYRPILMANINGMEEVLGDRCIQIVLSKSNNYKITKKVEIYENDTKISEIRKFQRNQCRLCRVVSLAEVYMKWNQFIDSTTKTSFKETNNDTNSINITNNINNTNDITTFFEEINEAGIDGRNLELMFPLIIIAYSINEDILKNLMVTLKEIVTDKKKEDMVESTDVALIDFSSQQLEGRWYNAKDLTREFKQFLQSEEEWINEKWLGRALKRLSLIKDKTRRGYGRMYILDIDKAQEKIRMFK